MRLPGTPHGRLGLGLGLLLLSAALFACLNPRPDDQPLFSSPDNVLEVPSTGAPPAGLDMGEDPSAGGSSEPNNAAAGSGPPDADAGVPPDAGPEDDEDAGDRTD